MKTIAVFRLLFLFNVEWLNIPDRQTPLRMHRVRRQQLLGNVTFIHMRLRSNIGCTKLSLPEQQLNVANITFNLRWNLIRLKRFHRNRLRRLRRTWRQGVLREVFVAWRLKQTSDESPLRPWLRLTDHAVALHSWQYQRLCSAATQAVRQDDKAFYDALAAEQGDIAADEGLSDLWRKIKHLLPKSVARRKANIRCTGPQVDGLTAHYAQLEAGQEVEYAHLLSQCAQRPREAQADLPLQTKLTDLPTRVEIKQVCKLAKRRKAPGLDGVQAEHLQDLMVSHFDVFY